MPVPVCVESIGQQRKRRKVGERVDKQGNQRGAFTTRACGVASGPKMNAEYALIVQIVCQFRNWPIETIDLGPIDRVEEHRAEDAIAQFASGI